MEPDERHPLLTGPTEDDDDRDSQYDLPQDTFRTADRVTVLALLALILFTMNVGGYFHYRAMDAIQTDVFCHQRGSNSTGHIIPGCDSPEVIKEFYHIRRVHDILALIPGLVTALPYGLLADKLSRRNLLALCVGGVLVSMAGEIIICMFPDVFALRLTWLTTLLTFIGGGPTVFFALVYAIANDVISRGQLSTTFLLLGSVATAANLLSFRLSETLMAKDPWVTIYIGLAMVCISTVLVLFIPATRDPTSTIRHYDDESYTPGNTASRLYQHVKRAAKEIGSTTRIAFWGSKRLGAVFVGIFFVSMSAPSLEIALSFSRNFWPTFEPMDMIWTKMLSSLVQTTILLPLTAQLLHRQFHLSPIRKDLWMARTLIILLVVGALLTGFSKSAGVLRAGTVLMAPAAAYLFLSRSLLSLISGGQHVALLFGLTAVVETVTRLAGSPLLRLLYGLGGNADSILNGLPFFMLAILFAVAGFAIVSIGAGDESVESDEAV